jgi:hypothetical protein
MIAAAWSVSSRGSGMNGSRATGLRCNSGAPSNLCSENPSSDVLRITGDPLGRSIRVLLRPDTALLITIDGGRSNCPITFSRTVIPDWNDRLAAVDRICNGLWRESV